MKVILGLGSNHGNRLQYLRSAILCLRELSQTFRVLEASPLYESDALLPEGAPPSWNQPFLNLALCCETTLTPSALLKKMKSIEEHLGRTQRGRWAPREMDIDILLIQTQQSLGADGPVQIPLETGEVLRIPHPGLYDRPFVLLPLADLIPDWEIPIPDSAFRMTVEAYVRKWKSELPSQIPFHTRRVSEVLTQQVGIVNLTPDSFSDGGANFSPEKAIHHIIDLIQSGVQIIDVGAESTRPGAELVPPDQEWSRLQPVLETIHQLRPQFSTPITISVDTRNPEVATQAIRLDADWINDVTGFQNPEMIQAVSNSRASLVMMHSLSVPPHRTQVLPAHKDPAIELLNWAESRIQEMESQGIHRNRIIFDPGIGFGKTPEQTWQLLGMIRKFHTLGVRVLIGHSRKSFFSSVTSLPASERDLETSILSVEMARAGVDYLRVHHPESQTRALKVWSQVDGITRYV